MHSSTKRVRLYEALYQKSGKARLKWARGFNSLFTAKDRKLKDHTTLSLNILVIYFQNNNS
jgi:hypothetical protein